MTKIVGIRISEKLFQSIERERKRRSRSAGVDVKTSAVIRALIEEALSKPKAA